MTIELTPAEVEAIRAVFAARATRHHTAARGYTAARETANAAAARRTAIQADGISSRLAMALRALATA